MTNQRRRVDERKEEMSSLRSGASGSSGTQASSSSLSSSSLTSPSMTTRSQSSNNNGSSNSSSSSNKSKTMNTLSLLDVDHHHVGRRSGGDRHLTCSVTGSSSDLKIGGGAGGYSLEPKTPNDKLNTPRTVTMHNTFFPSSPAPLVENDIGMSFNFIQNF